MYKIQKTKPGNGKDSNNQGSKNMKEFNVTKKHQAK